MFTISPQHSGGLFSCALTLCTHLDLNHTSTCKLHVFHMYFAYSCWLYPIEITTLELFVKWELAKKVMLNTKTLPTIVLFKKIVITFQPITQDFDMEQKEKSRPRKPAITRTITMYTGYCLHGLNAIANGGKI